MFHDDAPIVFESRWAMSYLRGPVTRNQIKLLMDPLKSTVSGVQLRQETGYGVPCVLPSAVLQTSVVAGSERIKSGDRPLLTPDVSQYFVPVRGSKPAAHTLMYYPMVIGAGQVHFVDVKSGVDLTKEVAFKAEICEGPIAVNWDESMELELPISDLETSPLEDAQYAELPLAAGKSRSYELWKREFANWLYRTQRLELLRSPNLKVYANLGETERDFRIRLQQSAREERDKAMEELRHRYAPKIANLEERIRRAQQAVQREEEQARQQKMQTAISLGATLLGSFMGRKAISSGSVGRATTTMRGVGRSIEQSKDVGRAKETVSPLQQRLQQLEADFRVAFFLFRLS